MMVIKHLLILVVATISCATPKGAQTKEWNIEREKLIDTLGNALQTECSYLAQLAGLCSDIYGVLNERRCAPLKRVGTKQLSNCMICVWVEGSRLRVCAYSSPFRGGRLKRRK